MTMATSIMLYLTIFTIIFENVLGATCPNGYSACVSVKNNCGETLYLQRTQYDGGNEGWPTIVTSIADGEEQILDISKWQDSSLGGQRLYAWWIDPTSNSVDPMKARDKVEINWCYGTKMCYNPTSVDNFGLPVYIGPYDSSDCPAVEDTGYGDIKVGAIEYECPTAFESTSPFGVCLSPYQLCLDWNYPSHSLCSHFDSLISTCQSDGNCPSGLTTQNVWGCNGGFATDPKWCAAFHRGLYTSVKNGGDQSDPTTFYQTSPYNPYAKFIHQTYAKQYAFPYDDYEAAEQSGYQECSTTFMKVEWCPSD